MFKNMLGILFLLELLQINRVVCQQNGDVRLNIFGDFYTDNGILEVFLTEADGWVPVCYDWFNDGAAAAACKQMGYCSYDSYRQGSNYVSDYSRYSYNVSCPYQDNYKDYGPLHLLQCQGNTRQLPCSQGPIYLVCGKCGRTCFINTDNPYSGQIYLYNDINYFNSSGILYLYYDNKWLPVCARSFNQYAADSACRQLGYTNAIDQGIYKEVGTSLSWYIDTIICRGKSYSCFKDCFMVLSNKEDCPNYEITCTFDFANKDTLLPGNKSECVYNTQPTTGPTNNHTGYIFDFVMLGTLIVCICVLAILIVVVCILYRRLARFRNYEAINN